MCSRENGEWRHGRRTHNRADEATDAKPAAQPGARAGGPTGSSRVNQHRPVHGTARRRHIAGCWMPGAERADMSDPGHDDPTAETDAVRMETMCESDGAGNRSRSRRADHLRPARHRPSPFRCQAFFQPINTSRLTMSTVHRAVTGVKERALIYRARIRLTPTEWPRNRSAREDTCLRRHSSIRQAPRPPPGLKFLAPAATRHPDLCIRKGRSPSYTAGHW